MLIKITVDVPDKITIELTGNSPSDKVLIHEFFPGLDRGRGFIFRNPTDGLEVLISKRTTSGSYY